MSDTPETVKTILETWLKANGYDGLVNTWNCGCQLGNLVPCQSACDECQPAYRGPAPAGEEGWGMYLTKEARDAAIKEAAK